MKNKPLCLFCTYACLFYKSHVRAIKTTQTNVAHEDLFRPASTEGYWSSYANGKVVKVIILHPIKYELCNMNKEYEIYRYIPARIKISQIYNFILRV